MNGLYIKFFATINNLKISELYLLLSEILLLLFTSKKYKLRKTVLNDPAKKIIYQRKFFLQ